MFDRLDTCLPDFQTKLFLAELLRQCCDVEPACCGQCQPQPLGLRVSALLQPEPAACVGFAGLQEQFETLRAAQ